MAQVKLQGNPVNTGGSLPPEGAMAPDFVLTKADLSDFSLKDLTGKKVVLNIFPSIDTPVCATSVRTFNAKINDYPDAVVVCVSKDLPFAHARFCGAEGLENVISASELRDTSFGDGYGVRISDGPLAGLFARAVIVLDEQGKVIYRQLVPEITEEPDYEAAFKAFAQ